LQDHQLPQLQEVGTRATGCRSKFSKELALIKVATADKAYAATNLIAEKRLQFHVCLPDAETVATTWSLGDTDQFTNQLER